MGIILEVFVKYEELYRILPTIHTVSQEKKALNILVYSKLQQSAVDNGVCLPIDWDRYWTKEEIDGKGFKIICRIPYTISPYNKFTNKLVQGNSYLFVSINTVDELIRSFENSISKKMGNSGEITERIQGEVSATIECLKKLCEFFKNCEGELVLKNAKE